MPYKDPEAHSEERRVYDVAYRAIHREQRLAKGRSWRAAHREEQRVYMRARRQVYQVIHHEDIKARHANYHAAHRETERTRSLAYAAAHREEARARALAWAKVHPEKMRENGHRRRARLRSQFVAPVNAQAIYKRDRGICHICGKHVRQADASMDHLKPISLGGIHAPWNVALAHLKCNLRRGARGPAQLLLGFSNEEAHGN